MASRIRKASESRWSRKQELKSSGCLPGSQGKRSSIDRTSRASSQTFHKGPGCDHFRLWGSLSLCGHYSFVIAGKQPETMCKQMSGLCSNKALFTKTGSLWVWLREGCSMLISVLENNEVWSSMAYSLMDCSSRGHCSLGWVMDWKGPSALKI